MQQLAIDADVVLRRIRPRPQLRHGLPVDLDPALEDDLLGSTPARDPGLRQYFLQPLAGSRGLNRMIFLRLRHTSIMTLLRESTGTHTW